MSLRPMHLLSVVAVAAALAVSGCGGGDSGGGSKSDYQGALDGFCKAVETGANKVQSDASSVTTDATSDPTGAVKKLGDILATFADTIDGGLSKLKSADVPSDYKSFNDKAVSGIEDLVTKVKSAAAQAKTGKVSAVTKLGTTLDDIKLPDLPSDIAGKTPSCKRISN